MTNELTDLTNIPAPTLTLDPVDDGEVAEASIIEVDSPAAPSLADSLSAEELAQVDAFAQQIDIANSQQVLTFGAGAQKKMASFSETALAKVRTQDLGEAGDLIAGVVTELKNFDVDDDDKGFFGLFKKSANKITSLKARYDTAEANVDKIAKTLEGHQVQLMKDAATLDKLYELNLTYFKELTMYLLAGRQRLAEVREGELADLSAKAQASGSTEDAEAVQKLAAACNRFEKKLSDLDLSRTVAMQMAPQIRLVQNNEMLMIEKIQTTLVNTIPLWKSQMLLALGHPDLRRGDEGPGRGARQARRGRGGDAPHGSRAAPEAPGGAVGTCGLGRLPRVEFVQSDGFRTVNACKAEECTQIDAARRHFARVSRRGPGRDAHRERNDMRVMALDIGEVRVGVAVSDPGERVASPVCVLPAPEVLGCAKPFRRLLEDWEPELFVCGLPKTLAGEEGSQAARIRQAAAAISKASGIPHVFADERLSSAEAKRSLREKGLSERAMRGKVDMIAASLFLQSWLDERARA